MVRTTDIGTNVLIDRLDQCLGYIGVQIFYAKQISGARHWTVAIASHRTELTSVSQPVEHGSLRWILAGHLDCCRCRPLTAKPLSARLWRATSHILGRAMLEYYTLGTLSRPENDLVFTTSTFASDRRD